ncbi:hypothetical protein CH296_01105 [Rhodococcus sp. 14-2496-1d]|uniref:type II toxin-antitoxin system VapC family toxin n=1 Tax=Rhodococcus sp. 14-2496-1d TaxID=2023146 RepID=UPI000B9AA904|nr:PIN domain-containing protein [Rhodococcus sp. 14-2496-1d]OZF39933.1 hypothetical protein CH296_01105 [Rhodococcus sp. 14-2496-1d]
MSSQLKRVVVDTCVVVDLLTGEEPEWAERARWLLAGHGELHEIVLPAIVVAEIAGCPVMLTDDKVPVDVREERTAKARDWIHGSGFVVAELSENLARRSAELAVQHRLRGADATVLATAMQWGEALFTRDRRLLGCKVPGLSIEVPREVPSPPESEMTLYDDDAFDSSRI